MSQRTFNIIKPDGVSRNITGKVINCFERDGLKVAAIKKIKLTRDMAEAFYEIHKDKPFFPALIDYMTSGAVIVMVIEGENAVARARNIMGATNPSDALPGTIRAEWGQTVTKNTVHGSDSPENAEKEINFFFKKEEIS